MATRRLPKDYQDAYNRRPLNVIKRAYHNILRRTSGLDPMTPKSAGLPVGFTQDQFILWTLNETRFWALYEQWQAHGYSRDWAPSIDRLDDDLGYVPNNVRWIVWHANQNKPRKRGYKHLLTLYGRTQGISAWGKEFGLTYGVIKRRLRRGWDIERALLTPKAA